MLLGKSDGEAIKCRKGGYINKQNRWRSFQPSPMSHQSRKWLHAPQLIRKWQMTPRRAQIPNKLLGIPSPIIALLPAN